MQIHVVVTSVILLYCCSNSTATAAHSFHPRFNNVTDQQSLLEFKAAITSDPHHSLANWNPNLSFCNWTGVTCSSRRQRVVAVELSDFGIARLVGINSLDSLTSTLPLRGSLGYMAPEYGFGTTASTNGDVYSFGIVLLEMLTRKRPVDEIFVDGLTLQKWVRMAFPNRILEVVDKSLLTHHSDNDMGKDNVFNCLVQFIHLGLLCTNESPRERPNMREIVEILERIKEKFVGARRSSLLQLDISSLLSSQTVAGNNMKASESQSSSTF